MVKYTVVTTFHRDGLNRYAQNFIDSFDANMPPEIDLLLYAHQCAPVLPTWSGRRIEVIEVEKSLQKLKEFKAKYVNDPRSYDLEYVKNYLQDNVMRGPFYKAGRFLTRVMNSFRKQFNKLLVFFSIDELSIEEKCKMYPSNRYLWDFLHSCHKVYTVVDASRRAKSDMLIWMDADTIIHSEMPISFLDDLLCSNALTCYIGREKMHSDCAWYSLNLRHPDADEFMEAFERMYEDAENGIFRLSEWHASSVFDHVRRWHERKFRVRNKNLSKSFALLDNHFTNSPLGQYFVHAEFHKNKDMGKNLAQYSDGDYSVSRWISGDSSSRTLVLLSCDGVYFRNYFSSIYGALVEHGKHIVLWVHLINPSDADIYEIKRMRRQLKLNDKKVGIYYSKTFKRFAASVDQQKAMLSYCSLARLLVMSRLLSLTKMDILSLDADTMVLRDFSALSQTMHICRCDLALRLGFCKKDRKSRFSMATIFVRWSNNSQLFTRELTKKIHEMLNSSNHIDSKDHEITMEVYNGLRQKVRLYELPLAYADHTYRSTTIIWDGAMI